jgi:glycosyltransferase involved in cell wall biosynthesis
MSSSAPSLSVVLLAYDEEENLRGAVEETVAFLERSVSDWELTVVDDGSTDRTAAIAGELAERWERVRLVRHGANRGMGAGMRTGIAAATKDYFVFNAADGQIPAAELGKLLPLLERADIALSTYSNRRESFARELVSRGFRAYLAIVAGIRFELQGLYLYPAEVARELAPLIAADTFFFSFELIQRGIERGLTTATTRIECRPRAAGSSKIFNLARVRRVGGESLRYGLGKRLR